MFGYLGHANNLYNNAMYVRKNGCFVVVFLKSAVLYNWRRKLWIKLTLTIPYIFTIDTTKQFFWSYYIIYCACAQLIITCVMLKDSRSFWRAWLAGAWHATLSSPSWLYTTNVHSSVMLSNTSTVTDKHNVSVVFIVAFYLPPSSRLTAGANRYT